MRGVEAALSAALLSMKFHEESADASQVHDGEVWRFVPIEGVELDAEDAATAAEWATRVVAHFEQSIGITRELIEYAEKHCEQFELPPGTNPDGTDKYLPDGSSWLPVPLRWT